MLLILDARQVARIERAVLDMKRERYGVQMFLFSVLSEKKNSGFALPPILSHG